MTTYSEACRQIALHLINSDLGFSEQQLEELRKCHETGETGYFGFSFELRNDVTSMNISIEDENRFMSIRLDDAGNEVHDATFAFKVNYPTHGSDDVDVQLRRFTFYTKVADVMKHLKDEFTGTYVRVARTKAQLEESAKICEKKRVERNLLIIVDYVKKNMRIGSTRTMLLTVGHNDVPDGTYGTTTKDGRRYKIEVKNLDAVITRLD